MSCTSWNWNKTCWTHESDAVSTNAETPRGQLHWEATSASMGWSGSDFIDQTSSLVSKSNSAIATDKQRMALCKKCWWPLFNNYKSWWTWIRNSTRTTMNLPFICIYVYICIYCHIIWTASTICCLLSYCLACLLYCCEWKASWDHSQSVWCPKCWSGARSRPRLVIPYLPQSANIFCNEPRPRCHLLLRLDCGGMKHCTTLHKYTWPSCDVMSSHVNCLSKTPVAIVSNRLTCKFLPQRPHEPAQLPAERAPSEL